MLILITLAIASAATLTVGSSGAYSTIAAAEAAAASGDVLLIDAGTWSETLDPNGKDLTYRSTAGAVIAGPGDCLVLSGEDVTLDGLTFSGCEHAVNAVGGSVTVRDSSFEDNTCGSGCAFYLNGTDLVADDATFSRNTGSSGGASIYAVNGADVTVRTSVFEDGSSPDGADVMLNGGGDLLLEDSVSTGAAGTSAGASVWVRYSGDVTITRVDLSVTGTCLWGGGVLYLASSGDVALTDSSFSGGDTPGDGGGLHLSSAASLAMDGVIFSGNSSGSEGGGAYIVGVEIVAQNTVFADNTAAYGGGLNSSSSDITLTDVDFLRNEASQSGGAFYGLGSHIAAWDQVGGLVQGNVAASYGGGLYINDFEPQLIAGVSLDGNTAGSYGGGAFLHGNYGCCGPTVLEGLWVTDNSADGWGGGIWSQYSGAIEVYSSVFIGNTAKGDGGGLGTSDSAVTVAGSLFVDNSAVDGSGFKANVSTVSLSSSTFVCNAGTSSGGGASLVASTAAVKGVVAAYNTANTALYVSASSRTLADNLVYGNSSTDWGAVSDPTGTNGNVRTNPGFDAYACDGDPTTEDLVPAAGSALIGEYAAVLDTDGSTGDIGAYGGPYGDLDADADGWTYWDGDCHEGRPDVNPGQPEGWYDGLDQDCDGGDDDDQDSDGYALAEDCDDADAGVSPGAAESWYDGIDQDCDGNDDDQDEDGWAFFEDCDDADAAVNPDASEVWYDGTDQDCDGNGDDQDGDGYALGDDCDDADAGVNPDSSEIWYDGTDQDCDGNDDDQDEDGYALAGDCDDTEASVNPSSSEIWYDGTDQDCDGNDDDQDDDGYALADDCDDADAGINPGSIEAWYDGVDQDCDGNDDDQDEDGWSFVDDCNDVDPDVNPGVSEAWYDGTDQDCDGNDDDQDEDGWSFVDDCNDLDADVNPAASQVWYDGVDQDCDGGDDDDQDGDGYPLAEDCDDADAGVNPDAVDVPDDGIDQDCVGGDEVTPGDTGPGDDTDAPADTGDSGASPVEEEIDAEGEPVAKGAGGCGCASGGSGASAALALLGMLLARRRVGRGILARK